MKSNAFEIFAIRGVETSEDPSGAAVARKSDAALRPSDRIEDAHPER